MRKVTWLLFSSLVTTPLLAQGPDPAALAAQYGAAAKANAGMLRQYSWKMRVEPTVKGEAKPAAIYQMRFDPDGKLQKTPLTAPSTPKKARGIRGAKQAEAMGEFQKWAGQLAELVKRYTAPSAGTMLDFYSKANVTQAPDGTAQISAPGFLQADDTATFWVDPKTKSPRRFAFTTTLQGDPVKGQVDYAQVANGPRYPARISIDAPKKQVQAKIETFDYIKQ